MKRVICLLLISIITCIVMCSCVKNTEMNATKEPRVTYIEENAVSDTELNNAVEKYAERALRQLLECKDVDETMKMHHPAETIQVILREMYIDVLEDFNDYGDYKVISCKHESTSTIYSGDVFESINDALRYDGFDTYESVIECNYEVNYQQNGKTETMIVPVYLVDDGEYYIMEIYIG